MRCVRAARMTELRTVYDVYWYSRRENQVSGRRPRKSQTRGDLRRNAHQTSTKQNGKGVLTTMRSLVIAFLLCVSQAFIPSQAPRNYGALRAAPDGNAQALTDYMAKSHEEKLRAVKDAEDKKNAEIQVGCTGCTLSAYFVAWFTHSLFIGIEKRASESQKWLLRDYYFSSRRLQ